MYWETRLRLTTVMMLPLVAFARGSSEAPAFAPDTNAFVKLPAVIVTATRTQEDPFTLPYAVDLITAAELERFEAELTTLWAAIVRDGRYGDFRPKKSKLCGWCSFQELCPAFGGTPPEYPGWPGAHGE